MKTLYVTAKAGVPARLKPPRGSNPALVYHRMAQRKLLQALRRINSNPHCKNRHKLNLNNTRLVERQVVCIQCEESP